VAVAVAVVEGVRLWEQLPELAAVVEGLVVRVD
jgi:hypothetical protein